MVFGYIASFAMGITLGLMGGGGAILTVPIMVYLFNLPPSMATGYSLFIVGLTAAVGSVLYIRRKEINFKSGLLFAVPSVIGVNISRGLILPEIPDIVFNLDGVMLTKDVLIMFAFAALMIFASYSMIKKRQDTKQSRLSPLLRTSFIVAAGSLVGIVAGFVGAGGGFLIIPTLVLLAGLPMRIAVGTSLTIIAVQSLSGFFGDIARGGAVDWFLLMKVSFIAVTGITVGSALSHRIKEQKLKVAFGWFVLLMGTIIMIEQFYL